MQRLCTLYIPLLLIFISPAFAQKKMEPFKFGDIKAADFAPTVYSIDSSASAIILADVGETWFEGNSKGNFSLLTRRFTRMRMINRNGFDAATIEIPLYIDGSTEEELSKLEAVTYNLENGTVVSTPVDKASIFKDKISAHHTVRKFTFPNIKEGSIIEYRYVVKSPFYFNLQPWAFQGRLPRLWSDFKATIPNSIFDYVLMKHGYHPYLLDTTYNSSEVYNIHDEGEGAYSSGTNLSVRSNTVIAHWIMKDVPPLKSESFITTLDNYKSSIEFQLRRIKYSESNIEEYMGDWKQLADRLMKRADFGVPLTENNGWLTDELKRITSGSKTDLNSAKLVYAYLRDNFTSTTTTGMLTTKPLKKTFQDKNGSVADINLLLVAALKKLGLDAAPAILSTRDNGKVSDEYPLIEQYNYVIARVTINGTNYPLDATNKLAGFGKLPGELYNGSARVIAEVPGLEILSADSLHESKTSTVFIFNNENGKGMSASFTTKYGDQESMEMREKLGKQKLEDYFKTIAKKFLFETDISNTSTDSLDILEEPLSVKYNFTFNTNGEDIIYFSPLLYEAYKENPFKSADRAYPVEMPYCLAETYILNMEIPTGYRVDEIPKSLKINFNGAQGKFEYLIALGATNIQLRCRILLNQANFDTEDYQPLREFFAAIVKKQSEQIVFKKIKNQ